MLPSFRSSSVARVAFLFIYRGVGLLTAFLLAPLAAMAQGQAAVAAVVVSKHLVMDEHHGVKIVDTYRWLEDGKSADAGQSVASENAHSLWYFQHAAASKSILQDIQPHKDNVGAIQRSLDIRAGRFFSLELDRTVQQ